MGLREEPFALRRHVIGKVGTYPCYPSTKWAPPIEISIGLFRNASRSDELERLALPPRITLIHSSSTQKSRRFKTSPSTLLYVIAIYLVIPSGTIVRLEKLPQPAVVVS